MEVFGRVAIHARQPDCPVMVIHDDETTGVSTAIALVTDGLVGLGTICNVHVVSSGGWALVEEPK